MFFLVSLLFSLPLVTNFCLSAEEKAVVDALSEYRRQHELTTLPLSSSLSYVAHLHTKDLTTNYDPENDEQCQLSSWSENGTWSPCCIQPKHPEGNCMWSKPSELSDYVGNGYEVVLFVPDSLLYPDGILRLVAQNDKARGLLLEQGWGGWKAMGVGLTGNYLSLWFGHKIDPAGVPEVCPNGQVVRKARKEDTEKGIAKTEAEVLPNEQTDSTASIEATQEVQTTAKVLEREDLVRYYLITASYIRKKDAEEALDKLVEEYPKAKVLSTAKHHRISIDDFTDLGPAKQRRKELLLTFGSLWILPEKE